MFFWGSYNFQAPQLVEHSERPPLRYPVYVPPTFSMTTVRGGDSVCGGGGGDREEKEEKMLNRIDERHVAVKFLACGQKHFVAVLRTVEHSRAHEPANGAGGGDGGNWLLYGMGSNHSGQLGHSVPEYTTTLTNLRFEALLPVGTAISSVACGNKHTLISTTSGGVFVAGDNSCNQLGVTVKSNGFAQVLGLTNIKSVHAAGNVSFALDNKGRLYSWGEAQYGHLCHGDDGERLDQRSLQIVKTNLATPTLVQWFVRHHVVIVEVAVARAHVVCRSSDDVYTCGEGTFGKLGTGSLTSLLTPHRVQFPERSHPERLCGIAAGDDHTLVLRDSPAVGSVVYHFGKMNNTDGQFVPTIVAHAPTNIARIGAGRGTVCTAVTSDGLLYVWGKHSSSSVKNGTPAESRQGNPQFVTALSPFVITDVVVGGTFIVATAESRRGGFASQSAELNEGSDSKNNMHASCNERWDVVVPHDDRVGRVPHLNGKDTYEDAVRAFFAQYLEPILVQKYIARMPTAPPLTDHNANAFVRIGASAITVGQKLRLWMTDVYALATVVAVLTTRDKMISICDLEAEDNINNNSHCIVNDCSNNNSHSALMHYAAEEDSELYKKEQKTGYRFRIEWQRDDWHDEEVTLYSDDETLNTENPNRWQPLWFLPDPHNESEYLLDK